MRAALDQFGGEVEILSEQLRLAFSKHPAEPSLMGPLCVLMITTVVKRPLRSNLTNSDTDRRLLVVKWIIGG